MIARRFYLYEKRTSELYDNTVDKINETNKLDELGNIYLAFYFTSNGYLNLINYALRCEKRDELIDLICSNHNKIRTLFLKKDKVLNNVTS